MFNAQRVAIFVDVQNMFYSAKLLHQSKIDYAALIKGATKDRNLIRATAYIVQKPDVNQAGFHEALSRQGYSIRIKELKIRETGEGGTRTTAKGSWDSGLTVDAMALASKIDVAVLCTGNGDYVHLVEALQNYGVRVEIVSFERSTSGELIGQADQFIPIPMEWMFAEKKFQEGGINNQYDGLPQDEEDNVGNAIGVAGGR